MWFLTLLSSTALWEMVRILKILLWPRGFSFTFVYLAWIMMFATDIWLRWREVSLLSIFVVHALPTGRHTLECH
jgi:hypothetical protein